MTLSSDQVAGWLLSNHKSNMLSVMMDWMFEDKITFSNPESDVNTKGREKIE